MSLAELFCMAPPIYPFSSLSGTCVAGEGNSDIGVLHKG